MHGLWDQRSWVLVLALPLLCSLEGAITHPCLSFLLYEMVMRKVIMPPAHPTPQVAVYKAPRGPSNQSLLLLASLLNRPPWLLSEMAAQGGRRPREEAERPWRRPFSSSRRHDSDHRGGESGCRVARAAMLRED